MNTEEEGYCNYLCNLSIAGRKLIWYLKGVAFLILRELFGSCIKSRDLTREHRGRWVFQLPQLIHELGRERFQYDEPKNVFVFCNGYCCCNCC